MSAIPKDAADIPTALPHPTGAATVINFHCVVPPFFTTTPNPTAPASSSPSSPSASDCYYSDPSSSSSVPSSASPSRPASRDSQLPPSPRDFAIEAHQAEYRAHAYLANESIVKTKLVADKFLQNLFKTQTEPDKDILRAASAASRARLQNPFAYNNSRSSSSSRSSGSSSGSSSYYSGSSGSSDSRSSASNSNSSSTPSAPHTPSTPAALVVAIEPSPADIDQPLTEADFAECIKLEDISSNIDTTATPRSTAPSSTAIPGGVLVNSMTTATPDTKTPPGMAVPQMAAAEQPNPATPESTEAAPPPESHSDLPISPPAPVEPLRPAPTEAEFRALEEELTKLSGRPFTISRSTNIHDPTTVARFVDHAEHLLCHSRMAKARDESFEYAIRHGWPAGP